jgi:hypothetical protein
MSITLDELDRRLNAKAITKYTGTVDYHGVPVEPWNHPKSIARYILKYVSHTHSFGCQFIAPMGHGKSTAATIISHYIHQEDSRYNIVWAEASDFRHLKRFLLSLPKEPTVIIFDDITSALKTMPEKEIEQNFEDLTKIRWIMDAAKGEVDTILFVNYHYSKNLEKEFRAVLGMTIFLAFGSEEHTNIDTILPKKTLGRKTLEHYSNISDKMFTQDQFQLMHSNGQVITYITDEPCRAGCAVMGKEARIILLSDKDQCKKCAKTNFKKYADPKEIIKIACNVYGAGYGKKALKMALYKRGFFDVFSPKLKAAVEYIENRIFTQFDVRTDQLAEEIEKVDYNIRNPKRRAYRKRKNEEKGLEELEETSTKEEIKDATHTPTMKKVELTERQEKELEQDLKRIQGKERKAHEKLTEEEQDKDLGDL